MWTCKVWKGCLQASNGVRSDITIYLPEIYTDKLEIQTYLYVQTMNDLKTVLNPQEIKLYGVFDATSGKLNLRSDIISLNITSITDGFMSGDAVISINNSVGIFTLSDRSFASEKCTIC